MERKNAVIPGYKGFVPGIKEDQGIGKNWVESSRGAFNKSKLDDKPYVYSTTGYLFMINTGE